jgi:hypothetical protein
LSAPISEGHAALVAAIYRELLPAGIVPASAPGLLARVHDRVLVADHGLDIDAAVAASAVADASEWIHRWEGSTPSGANGGPAAVALSTSRVSTVGPSHR